METVAIAVGLLALASLSSAGSGWDAFQVTSGDEEKGTGYFKMPLTVKEATAQGKWKKIDEDKGLDVSVFAQDNDPSVMLLFDKKENIAGLRLSFLKKNIDKKAKEGGFTFDVDYDHNPAYTKANYFGKELWYGSVLFASPERLKSGGRNVDKYKDDVAEELYFKADGKWTELTKEECKLSDDFIEGSCFAGMGKHYFYKMDDKSDCKHREPFWSFYDEGKLIGFGLAGYGSFSKNNKTQNYYEDIQLPAAKALATNGPKCIDEFITKYGLTSMHVYLKKNAAKITCPPKEWRSTHC